jgi:hypothetical protein
VLVQARPDSRRCKDFGHRKDPPVVGSAHHLGMIAGALDIALDRNHRGPV